MTCLFVSLFREVNVCKEKILGTNFCLEHNTLRFDSIFLNYCSEKYQDFFKSNKSDLFDRCLKSPSITAGLLERSFRKFVQINCNSDVITKIVEHPKFDYDTFLTLDYHVKSSNVQDALSLHFYKNWLIKLALISINEELTDCARLIMYPYHNLTTTTPYYLSKYVLNIILYPRINLYCDRVVKISFSDITIKGAGTQNQFIFVVNDTYLVDNVSGYYIAKKINGQLFDLDDSDLIFLNDNDKGKLVIDGYMAGVAH